ncbi:tetratricopeptide repeat protein [Saccharothrix sp. HUAS TT1]|uniref:tetratricopeptide repeat protein n=1 Tax=unclassified Saccharothrix TaxID=2593673 RepID=UPI00345C166E
MRFRWWRRRAEPPGDEVFRGPEVTVRQMPSVTAARQAAAGGSPAEMNRLGVTLKLDGRHAEAAEWFRKAAEAGNDDAMANLATYLMSQGRNAEAARWFRRAGGPLGEALAARLEREPDRPTDPGAGRGR